MREALFDAFKVVVSVVIPLAGLAAGLRVATLDPLWLLKRPALLLRSLLAIFVLVPLGAVIFLEAIGASALVETGLIVAILAVGIGPPAVLKHTRDPNAAYEVELNVVLMALAILFVPAAVAILGMYFQVDLRLGASRVAEVVLTRALIPMLVGVLVARLVPGVAARLVRVATTVVHVALVLVVAVALAATWRSLFALGARAWITSAAIALWALAVGHLCGGPERSSRRGLALLSTMRFPGMALLIASITPLGRQVVPVVLSYVVASAVLMALYGVVTSERRRPAGEAAPVVPAPGEA